jgi:CBS domain containing-hemolysin-like protein
MEDKFAKYLQLSNRLIITLVCFVAAVLLLLFGLRLVFGLLDSIPWFKYLFSLFIIMVPALVLITVFLIYFSRTKQHSVAWVRYLSWGLFVAALLVWGYFLVADFITFFQTTSQDIGNYHSYSRWFLAGSVALIFIVGIIQALSTEKEKDWLEKRRERESLLKDH